MQKLKLKVMNTQRYETHQDTNEEVVEAVVANKNGSDYITYKEYDETTTSEVSTLIKIKDDLIKVKRMGHLKTELLFEKGNKHMTTYHTMYGMMEIAVDTKEVQVKVEDNDVYLKLEYTLSMQDQVVSKNTYVIQTT